MSDSIPLQSTDSLIISFTNYTSSLSCYGELTAITANIKSGDFDIGGQGLQGDGDEMMRVSRIFPDFSSQTGQAKIQLDLKDFPNDTSASSSLGPFTVDANTKKIDSRARGRFISLYEVLKF